MEPILTDTKRVVLFPIRHHDIFKMAKSHLAVQWFAEEVDLSKDMPHWNALKEDERHFIKHVLGFFAGSDGLVMENLAMRFSQEVQWPEAKYFYAVQNQAEAIHAETYSLLIDTYISEPEEKLNILNAIETIPSVEKKAAWVQKWIESDKSFAARLLAFAVVEGIFFSGSFCSIFWLKERGLMPGLTLSNEFIARDEGIHTDFACLLYSKLQSRLSVEEARGIIEEAVAIETEFITEALPCALIGMNAALMAEYIKFVADRLSIQLGYERIYSVGNPFSFMERISLENKDNFFEKRVSTYAKSAVGKKSDDMKFSLAEAF
jgi:ribonucleoside-diphosphate reductase beta chain